MTEAPSDSLLESTRNRGRAQSWDTIYQSIRQEDTPLLFRSSESTRRGDEEIDESIWSHRWIPGFLEDDARPSVVWEPRRPKQHHYSHRSIRRRIFLLLTEPTTSFASAIFFVILIITIAMSNVIMIMQTMDTWQFTPDDCLSCGGNHLYVFEDDSFALEPGIECVCPPAPLPMTVKVEDYIVYFFTVEWSLRVFFYEPPPAERARGHMAFFCQWLGFLGETTTIMDALAIFPYYAERFEKTNGLMSLRLLRLFRVFQLVRLGQYNSTFMSLTNVLYQSMLYLKLLMVVLLFGAAFFGSMMYWLEKGDWKYDDDTKSYKFLRESVDGNSYEPSPFTSIPKAFWWFLVTATTVGYGDMYPTTTGGRLVAAMAMLTGVLVIAFPVSVFSELWSQELKARGVDILNELEDEESEASEEAPDTNGGFGRHKKDSFLTASQLSTNAQSVTRTLSPIQSSHEADVTMAGEDLAAIKKYMRTVEVSQERIRRIFAKYDIES